MNDHIDSAQSRVLTLHKVGSLCEKRLYELFENLLDKSDTVFYDLAQSASPKERQGFYDTMRLIRLQRQEIEQAFRFQLHTILDRMPEPGSGNFQLRQHDELMLMDEEELTENIAFDAMIKRALTKYEQLLQHLLSWYQYAYGSYEIQSDWLPVHPVQLGNAVRRSLKVLKLSARVMSVVYQLYEREVLSHLGEVLQAAIALFSEAEAVAAQPVQKAGEVPMPVIRQLTDVEQNEVTDFVNDMVKRAELADITQPPVTNTEELMHSLQNLQQKTSSIDDMQKMSLRDVLARFIRIDREYLGVLNGDMVMLVNNMFSNIMSSSSLADEFRAPISRLQLPILQIALQDRDVFTDRDHPARLLVNEMTHAGLGFDPQRRGNDVVLNKVHELVAQIVNTIPASVELYEQWLTDFQLTVREEYKRSVILERRVHEAEEGKARTEAAKRAADQVLLPLMHDREISPEVQELLNDIWRRLLQLEHVRAHGSSDSFKQYQLSAELILQSVDYKLLGLSENRELMYEKVRNQLRDGFDAMGLPVVETAQWLRTIETEQNRVLILIQEMRNAGGLPAFKSNKEDVVSVIETSSPLELPDVTLQISTIDDVLGLSSEKNDTAVAETIQNTNAESAESAAAAALQSSSNEDFLAQDIDIHALQNKGIPEEIWEQVDNLPVPCWMLLAQENVAAMRCKLAAKIPSIGRFIFVNRSGIKVKDMQRDDVAAAVADGSLSLLDDGALFDKALLDVIQNLRKLKTEQDSAQVA